jgi:hypothetical protein
MPRRSRVVFSASFRTRSLDAPVSLDAARRLPDDLESLRFIVPPCSTWSRTTRAKPRDR